MAKKKVETISEIINRRRYQALDRMGYISLLLRIVVLVLAAWVLMTKIFLVGQVSGNAMFPSIKDGDVIIGYRLQSDYVKNDCVVFTIDGKTHVGRVVARQYDVVTLDDSGKLYVNGAVQEGEIIYPTYAKENVSYPCTLLEGELFVLGDYRTQAEDSRDFGPVLMSEVEGKIITILRRRGL
ncbi:MAG: signal peptidase I [Erysipelotrichaceae bacterium]|nr:signal peptidase I [Erysipelotrichaceae bacterium]